MEVFRSIADFNSYRHGLKKQSIGFVATMGALHAGHQSLIELCQKQCAISIVSIFINPTQFDNPDDLSRYPNVLEQDLKLLNATGVDAVLVPDFDSLYPDNYAFKLTENMLSQKYCGAHRVGHFDGVLTVVMKLLNIIRPNKAYFGEKDYQQLTLIRQMVEAFFMPIEIVAGVTLREKDGLAMSSRNVNLSPEQRIIAVKLYQTLCSGLSIEQMKAQLQTYGFKVDYLQAFKQRLLVAAYLGQTRLIDNVECYINVSQKEDVQEQSA